MLAAINEVELLLSLDQIDYSYSANLTLNQMIEGKVLRAYVHGMCSDIPCVELFYACLLYTSPSPRDKRQSRMPSSA